jgi:hypothetical protein
LTVQDVPDSEFCQPDENGYLTGYKVVKPEGNILVSEFLTDFVWKSGELLAVGPLGKKNYDPKAETDGKGFYVMLKKPDPLWVEEKGMRTLEIKFKKEDVVNAGMDQNHGYGYCAIVSKILITEAAFQEALTGEKQKKAAVKKVKAAKKVVKKAKKAVKVVKKTAKAVVKKAKATVRAKKKAPKANNSDEPGEAPQSM